MKTNRILDHPVLGKLDDQEQIHFSFDGDKYVGYAGDTIASALLANGIRTLRVHEETGTPRGFYCNIGHCFECRVTVNQSNGIRACLTEIKDDMVIESGKVQALPLKKTESTDSLPHTYAEFKAKSKDKEDDSLV